MPTSPIVDLVIGLLFFFTAFSLLSSTIQERIASALDLRSRDLEAWIVRTLGPEGAKAFYAHPLIGSLGGAKASYIPADAFATALFETCRLNVPQPAAVGLAPDPLQQDAIGAAIRKLLSELPDVPMAAALRIHFEHAQGDVSQARDNVERWFNAAMDRVSGAYKRRTHWNLILVALVVSVVLDADALRVARVLYRDPVIRAALAEQARATGAASTAAAIDPQALASKVPVPLAWSGDPLPPPRSNPAWYVYKLLGLLITVAGVSLGAPFWFDLLNRIVNVRSAGVKPAPST